MTTVQPDMTPPAPAPRSRLVIGTMTGTSIDALDVAAVRVAGRGAGMEARFVAGESVPLGALAGPLRELAEQRPMTAGAIWRLNEGFSLLHAGTIERLITRIGERPALVALHGQTVFHDPPASWQLINPAVVAHRLGVPVVSDLRAADLACGGQGAPITPAADRVLFAEAGAARAVVNLGGFCNVTLLGPRGSGGGALSGVWGFDACACNHVLDRVARTCLGVEYDEGGAAAMSARADGAAAAELERTLAGQGLSGRSLGTGDEAGAWISRHGGGGGALSGPVLAASAARAIARAIAGAIGARAVAAGLSPAGVLIAGGGARNGALVGELRTALAPVSVEPTDAAGVPGEFREAAGMAVLGALCDDGVPITGASTTGVGAAPIAGCWTCP